MKILVIGDEERYRKLSPAWDEMIFDVTFCPRGTGVPELISACPDAEVIFADAISVVNRELIDSLPNLKMVHSEGVAFDKIDTVYAAQKGIFVCNQKGLNAKAVAEQAVLLMLELLRDAINSHKATIEGNQIQFKEAKMVEGIRELGCLSVGLVGFGDIARATAVLLNAFGSKVYYWNRSRRSAEEEAKYNVEYLSLDELASKSDIISLHLAVTPETVNIINDEFISKMKHSAYIINTARGDLIDNDALRRALIAGSVGGAGFDCIAPEPTPADHPLVDLPENIPARVIYTSHIGGITTDFFSKGFSHLWANAARIANGERPDCIVNDL